MSGLSKRQIEALRANAATAEDILENGEFVKELNEEIEGTYDQTLAHELAASDPTMANAQPFNFDVDFGQKSDTTTVEEPVMADIFEMPQETELEKELEELRKRVAAEEQAKATEAARAPQEPEVTPEEAMKAQVLQMLAKNPKAPTEAQIEKLKAHYGQDAVHVVAFGENDVYIFTHLRRSQWKKIQEVVSTMARSESMAGQADVALKEKVVQNCVIWPTEVRNLDASFLHNSRAGLIDTMFELVMLHSYFLTPAQAMNLTVSL